MAVTYAFDFVLANFGIAIAAKMPMMTTTISSSMSVKPFRARYMVDMKALLENRRNSGNVFGRCLTAVTKAMRRPIAGTHGNTLGSQQHTVGLPKLSGAANAASC